jgi:hypothetical protein
MQDSIGIARAQAGALNFSPSNESAAAAVLASASCDTNSSTAAVVTDDRFLLITRVLLVVASKLSKAIAALADWRCNNACAEVEDTAELMQCITTTRCVLAQGVHHTFPGEFYADFFSHATELLSTVEDESDANCRGVLAEAYVLVDEILELPVAVLSAGRSTLEAYNSVFQERMSAAEYALPPFPAVNKVQHRALRSICLDRYRQLLSEPGQAELVEYVRYDLEVSFFFGFFFISYYWGLLQSLIESLCSELMLLLCICALCVSSVHLCACSYSIQTVLMSLQLTCYTHTLAMRIYIQVLLSSHHSLLADCTLSLFGSPASGIAGPHSDIDISVTVPAITRAQQL